MTEVFQTYKQQYSLMKQLFIFLITLFASINLQAQSASPGQLKITLLSAKCINKSWDGVVEFDGHGNEISVASSFIIYDANNPAVYKMGSNETVIYGSAINGMTRAGTQTPDLGGITNGDEIQINKVMLNEHINANDNILFSPVLWEWDGPEKNTINNLNAQLVKDLIFSSNQLFPFRTDDYKDVTYQKRIFDIGRYPNYGERTKYSSIFQKVICPLNGQGNRVIGIYYLDGCKAFYVPLTLVLDAKLLSQTTTYNNNLRKSTFHDRPAQTPTTVMFSFKEETYQLQSSNGNYTATFDIEFTPDVPNTTKTAELPARKTLVKENIPIKGATALGNATMIVGKWAGTQTNSDGLYPQSLSFELTSAGEFIMRNAQTGAIVAKGNYTFSQGSISGNYMLLASNEQFSFTGTLDANTQQLNCSLGAGTSTTGQGKWRLIKN